MNTPSENIKNTVLEKIRHGDVVMRPKAYFVMQVILVVTVAILALIASSFVASFAFFSVRESGELFLLGFGVRGVLTFISLFPWCTLIIAGVLVFLFEWLLRHFKFTYHQPILALFFAFLALVFIGGIFITLTPFHTDLLNLADKGELPVVGELYEHIHMPHEDKGEFRGVITAIGTSTVTITHNDNDADIDDGTRIVTVPPSFDIHSLRLGDRLYVAGALGTSTASSTIIAYGLQVF
jgi:hypothetical protein